MKWHAFLRVVVVLSVAALLGGCSSASGGIESSSLASTSAEPSAPSPGAPFPSTIEGRDVLHGEAALSQMRASPTDWYLVGGWVRIVMVDGYSYSGTNVLFFPTDPEGASATAATAFRLEGPDVLQLPQNRPIVLEVQLDLSCTVQQGPCPFLMVKRVVWTQRSGSVPPTSPGATSLPMALSIQNATTTTVTVVVNGTTIETVPPGTQESPIKAAVPALPWNVETRSPSGRVLSTMTVHEGDATQTALTNGGIEHQGDFARADLSCGRLDVWAGDVQPMGPPPDQNASYPVGDCA